MCAAVVKGKLIRKDIDNYDGTLTTTRADSSGGTTSGLKVGDAVDVLSVFGSGDTANMTLATMNLAKSTLGTQNCSLSFAPGTWNVTDNITFASNFTLIVPAGCVFAVSAGKTLTVQGVLFREHGTYSSGAGTVTVTGTDLLATVDTTSEYAVDTGSADVYVIAPSTAIASYSSGQFFRFKATNNNTGASTLNVSSKGAKDLKTHAGAALPANTIVANGIYACTYDATLGYFVLHDDVAGNLPLSGGTMTGDITMTSASIIQAEGAAITAAATTEIWTTDGDSCHITGNTGISSFGTAAQAGMRKLLIMDGTPLLTHAANLNLPGSVDYQCAAGDILDVYADTTTQHDVRVFKQSVSGGRSVVFANGTKSSGTFTPVPANGEMQSYTNGGAHTLAPPALSGTILMTITNDGSAGAITTSGFGDVFGDAFTTTNAHIFMCLIIYDGTNSVLKVKALQ